MIETIKENLLNSFGYLTKKQRFEIYDRINMLMEYNHNDKIYFCFNHYLRKELKTFLDFKYCDNLFNKFPELSIYSPYKSKLCKNNYDWFNLNSESYYKRRKILFEILNKQKK